MLAYVEKVINVAIKKYKNNVFYMALHINPEKTERKRRRKREDEDRKRERELDR